MDKFLGMYRIVIWRILDIRQIEQGRIPDIRLLIIARYQISGSKMPDIRPEIAGYPAIYCRISGNILALSYKKLKLHE